MATNPTPATPAPITAKPLSGSHDPFVELVHLVKRTAHHIHDFVKNKDAHLATETAKTAAAAEALTQHPMLQQAADDAAEEATETAKASALATPAPDTPPV